MIINSYIYVLVVVALIFLLDIVHRSSYISKMKNSFYICAIVSNMLVLIGYVCRELAEAYHSYAIGVFSSIIIYSLSPFIGYCLCLASIKKPGTRTNILLGIPSFLHAIIAFTSPFTNLSYIISSDGMYSRGPLYLLDVILSMIYLLIWVILSFKEYSDVEFKDKLQLLGLFILEIFAVFIQVLNSPIKTTFIGTSFVLLLYYAFVIETTGKYDELTGIRNRMFYYYRINDFHKHGNYTVIVYDANGLKQVNDKLGHISGDLMIKTIARTISDTAKPYGSAYRIGGDEFVVLTKDIDEASIISMNNTINDLLKKSEKTLGFPISVSWGYCICENNNDISFEEIQKTADSKMYLMKQEFYNQHRNDRRSH